MPDAGRTVLVIDDEPRVLRLCEQFLTQAGYRVLTAQTAVRGWDEAHRTRPDLLVVDHKMPGCDGLELLYALRQDPVLSGTPAILMGERNSFYDYESYYRTFAFQADGWVLKPFSPDELVQLAARLSPAPPEPS